MISAISKLGGLAVLLIAGVINEPITITDSGIFQIVVDADGKPAFAEITEVIDLRTKTGDKPDPEPPIEEPPAPPEGISQDVAKWTVEAGDITGAKKYSLLFEIARDGVESGKIPVAKLFPVLRESADAVIGDKWGTFRINLGDYLNEQLRVGNFKEKAEIVSQLELIRYGIAYAVKDSEPLSDADALVVLSKVGSIIEAIE